MPDLRKEQQEKAYNINCCSTFFCRKSFCCIVIREKGQSFDISKENTYSPPDLAGENPHGLGMFLLNKLLDNVEYNILGLQGKEMRLAKYMRSRPVAPTLPAAPAVAQHSQAKPSSEVTLKIGLFTNADAVEISRCAFAIRIWTSFTILKN